jgi:predicted permease
MATVSPMAILEASLTAVAITAVMASTGIFLGRKGFITPEVSKGLSEISMTLTIPCLLFTTPIDCPQDVAVRGCPRLITQLREAWPMLFLPIIYVGVGVLVGTLAARVGNASPGFKRTAIAAVALGNNTGLPITLLTAVHSQFPKDSDLGSVDPVLFLSVYLVLYPVLQWTVGGHLLQSKLSEPMLDLEPMPPKQLEGVDVNLCLKLELPSSQESDTPSSLSPRDSSVSKELTDESSPELQARLDYPRNSNILVQLVLPSVSCHDLEKGTREEENVQMEDVQVADQGDAKRCKRPPLGCSDSACLGSSTKRVIVDILQRIFTPPVVAAILGVLISLSDPVRGVFVNLGGAGQTAPLEFLFKGMQNVGAAAVPINMFVMGNSLNKGATAKHGSVSLRTAFCIAMGKLIIMPSFGLSLTLLMQHLQLVSRPAASSFYFAAMTVSATPTANNIMVMAELASDNKQGLAACIFLQYLMAPVLLTFWLAAFTAVATGSLPWL